MILHMDNFSIYGRNRALMTNGIYAATSSGLVLTDDPDGSPGTVMRAVNNGSNNDTFWRYVFQTGVTSKAGIAVRWWWDALPESNEIKTRLVFRDNGNKDIMFVGAYSTGQIAVAVITQLEPDLLITYYVSELPIIGANGWNHIEILAEKPSPTTLSCEVRVEGIPVLSFEGVPSQNSGGFAQVAGYRFNIGGNPFSFYKDLVIYNGDGPDNNTFLGSVLVMSLLPEEDVALNWAPSVALPGYDILNNSPPNPAQYLQAVFPGTPPAYVCEVSNLPEDVSSVKAVMSYVRAAKTDGGDAQLQMSVISSPDDGPATANGADRPITVAQTYWRDVFERDPKTNAPWTPGAVDDVQLKMNRTA